jgi:hypothetical protein
METGIENLTRLEKEIKLGLIQNQRVINDLKSNNPTDISFLSELFLEELLNAIYSYKGWHFRNLNFAKTNYPAIDLADLENRICFQITVTNSTEGINQKIKDTLQSFFDRGMDKDYDQLFIIIASGIESPNKVKIPTTVLVKGIEFSFPISLFDKKKALDLNNLYKVIFDDLGSKNPDRINNILYKIPYRPQKEDLSFNPKHTYIPRNITNVQGHKISLVETLEKEKRMTLLGVGGLGKTTELNFLANAISRNPNNFCFKVRLINYSNSLNSLLDARCKNWQNVPSGYDTYFLLDGFDEVDSNKMQEAANEIKNFAFEHPDFKILVSCRTNFNPFEIVDTDNTQKEKDQFCTCYLKEISEDDIFAFIQNECKNPDSFKAEIIRNKFFDVFKNPYYLANAVEIYNSSQLIPENKVDFFQKLFVQRVLLEKEKNPVIGKRLDEYELEESLKILALTMQFAGTYKITKREFNQLLRAEESRETVKRIFFNQNGDDWQFEHNNFQEFLAAQKVSEQGWNTIRNIILLNNGKLKPKWLNAFSFLVNLVEEDNELINYFIVKDIDSLVKVEPHKVEKSIRNKIFLKIFNRHKKEESVIWRNVYSENDLFNFGEFETNDELISFLLAEIKPNDSVAEIISNTVHILSHLKHPDKYINDIKPLYLSLLTRENIHKYGISSVIIESFSKWKIFDAQTKNELVNSSDLFNKDAPLSTLCSYLAEGNFKDISAELVHKFIEAFKEQRVFDSEYSLLEVLKLLSHEQLTELILLEVPDNNKNRDRTWINDLYKLINTQAIETYHPNSKIDQAIIQFVYASVIYHDENYANQFKSFFEETGLVEKSFKSCFLDDLEKTSNRRREFFVLPALIANKECLDWVIDLYSKEKISNDNVWHFMWALTTVGNQEGRVYIEGPMNQISNNYFKPGPNLWEIFNKEKKDLWYKALLDQKLALKLIQKAFDTFEKEQLTKHEVIEKQFDHEDRYKDVELIVGMEFISHYSDDDIEKDEFIERFSKEEYWNWVVIKEHIQRLNHLLPNENIKWIHNWCDERIHKVVIKGAITSVDYNKYSFLTETNYFIHFALFLDLKLDESKLLEMTSLIGFGEFYSNINGISTQYRLYDYIKRHLPGSLLKNQILKNLEDGGLPNFILAEHIRVVETENWHEALPFLPKYIFDTKVPKYAKQHILNIYQTYHGDSDLLIPVLEILDFKSEDNYFDWNIIDFMVEEKNPHAISFLKELHKEKDSNHFKIGICLIKAESEEGFLLVLDGFSSKFAHSDDELLRTAIINLDLNVFDLNSISELLLRLLEKYISMNLGNSGSRSLLPVVFDKFFEIVSKTSIDESVLTSNIENLLEQSEKNETKKNARYHFNEFLEKVNQHKDKSLTVPDAIRELKALGICYEI